LRGALTTPVVNHRASIVDPGDIGALLRAIDGFVGQSTTRAAHVSHHTSLCGPESFGAPSGTSSI
jgi:hypothetical protein